MGFLMIENIRAWLSIQMIWIGINLCPYPEMRELLKRSINMQIEEYLDESE